MYRLLFYIDAGGFIAAYFHCPDYESERFKQIVTMTVRKHLACHLCKPNTINKNSAINQSVNSIHEPIITFIAAGQDRYYSPSDLPHECNL